MAKATITFPNQYWRRIATLAGGDPPPLMYDADLNELEVPDVKQANLDIDLANFDVETEMPSSWPTNPDLSAVAAVSTLYWKNDVGNIVGMVQAEKDTSDNTHLDTVKKQLVNEIDVACEIRIHSGTGFEWPPASGKFFSLSANAQVKWVGLAVSKDFITFPIVVPTKNDDVFHSILDATEALSMYLTASNTIQNFIAKSTIAKQAIRTATTVVEAHTAADAYLNQ